MGETTKPGKIGQHFDESDAGNAEIPPLGKPQLVERVFPVQLRLGGSRKGSELLPKLFCNYFNEGNKNSVHRSNKYFLEMRIFPQKPGNIFWKLSL